MQFVIYPDGSTVHLIITDGIVGVEEDAIEFSRVYTKGYFNLASGPDNPDSMKWNGFAGQESYFIMMLGNDIKEENIEIYKSWDAPQVQQLIGAIANNTPIKNRQTSIKAIFQEIDPEGNDG